MGFKQLRRYEVKGDATAWFDLPEAGHPNCAIEVRPTTRVNKPYHNATLRSTVRRVRKVTSERFTVDDVEKAIKEDREIFPKCVIVNWRNLPDDDHPGEFIPYSREAAVELVDAMPDTLFEDLRDFCGNIRNFYPEGVDVPLDADLDDTDELAEN